MWTHPPFEPVIEGDWLYGRGGADMKAGHAANIFALDACAASGSSRRRPFTSSLWLRKNSTGNGALMTHLRGYKADAVLIPEPEDEKLVRANLGVLWFRSRCVAFRSTFARWARAPMPSMRRIGSSASCGAWRRMECGQDGPRHFENEDHPSISTSARSRAATGPRPCRRGAGSIAGSPSIRANRLTSGLARSETASRDLPSIDRSSPTCRRRDLQRLPCGRLYPGARF